VSALAGAGLRGPRLVAPALVLATLTAWEALARGGAISPLFFPPPSAVAVRLAGLLAGGELFAHLRATLGRVALGFALGAVAGLPLGLLMGWSARIRAALDPLVAAVHPMPKVAMLPLLMLLLGIGEAPKVAVVAMATFFPLVINATAGVRQIGAIYFEVADSYRADRLKVLSRIVLPGSLPFVLAGTRLALNAALLITVAVELVAAPRGLGHLVWLAWQTLRTEDLYAALVVTALLGVALNGLLTGLSALLVPWQEERIQ
jgi:NitT/TauT family transport system permease protein